MSHPIYRVRSFEIVSAYTLRVRFDDNTEQTIDFRPILVGELYDPPARAGIVQPGPNRSRGRDIGVANGADFDPATLHDWPSHEQAFRELARRWEPVQA